MSLRVESLWLLYKATNEVADSVAGAVGDAVDAGDGAEAGSADATDVGDDERADDTVEATGEVVYTSFGREADGAIGATFEWSGGREAEANGATGATVEWSGGREADGVIGEAVESCDGGRAIGESSDGWRAIGKSSDGWRAIGESSDGETADS